MAKRNSYNSPFSDNDSDAQIRTAFNRGRPSQVHPFTLDRHTTRINGCSSEPDCDRKDRLRYMLLGPTLRQGNMLLMWPRIKASLDAYIERH